jgi:hypothetical protein
MKNEDIIFDLVKEVREEQKEIRNEIHQQNIVFTEHLATDAKMYEEISNINKTLYLNTESLREHMKQTMLVREQTDILKQLFELQSKRIDDLTKPLTVKDFATYFIKVCGWISAVAGAIYGLSRFF